MSAVTVPVPVSHQDPDFESHAKTCCTESGAWVVDKDRLEFSSITSGENQMPVYELAQVHRPG